MDRKNNPRNRYSTLDLKWKDEYNTGIAEIDCQHQYFLSSIKRITTVMTEKNEHAYCQRLFMELVYYTKFHFYSEENIMMHLNYAGLKEHQELHRDLIDLLTNKINSIDDNMDEYHKFVQFLLKWFVHHSMEEDKKIAHSKEVNGVKPL
ncbi:MAG: hemerythrin domain-containing protein [Desulfamplus sp.]|nr:hemerythrin domain-containing protein [Desulfamplus sp.]